MLYYIRITALEMCFVHCIEKRAESTWKLNVLMVYGSKDFFSDGKSLFDGIKPKRTKNYSYIYLFIVFS